MIPFDVPIWTLSRRLPMASSTQGNRQDEILRTTIPFMILATLSVIARYIAGKSRDVSLGVDDYVIVLPLVRDCRLRPFDNSFSFKLTLPRL